MAPRAKASDNPDSEPPRRSTRIAAIPAAAEAPKPAAARKASSSKKRATEEDASAESSTKKAKAVDQFDDDDDIGVELEVIDVGGSLPVLTLKNEKGEDVEVSGLTNEKGVVFFLVPKADTPGCTTQACGYRDIYPDFTALNFDVYCLSADSPSAQSKWQIKKELPYPLISDPKRTLISALGASEGGKTKRSHFIFEKGGKLVDRQNPVKPGDSPRLALEFIKSLQVEEGA